MEKPRLLITGITGYVGSWVCHRAVKSGKYRVRGTARNIESEEKKKLLGQMFGDLLKEIEVVEVDLSDTESVRKAVEGKILFEVA